MKKRKESLIKVGMRFGKLVVLKKLDEMLFRSYVWEVRCDCGKIKKYESSVLKKRTCCGCEIDRTPYNISDLVGKTCGKMVVLERMGSDKDWSVKYRCKCNKCGKESIIKARSLSKAIKKSGGCIYCRNKNNINKTDFTIIGKRFGKVVINEYIKRIGRKTYWKCICDCGASRIVERGYLFKTKNRKNPFACKNCSKQYFIQNALNGLKRGYSKSKPESIVDDWLTKYNISHQYNFITDEYQFDFLLDFKTIIEVHGDFWHCNPILYPSGPMYFKQKEHIVRDEIKKDFLQKEGYKLYIIWEHDIKKGDFSALYPLLPKQRLGGMVAWDDFK